MSCEVGSGLMRSMAHRIFTETIPMPGITPGNNVVASLTEVDVNGNPFIGDATMKIYNVAPRNGDIQVRGEVDRDDDIDIRISVIFQ